MGGRSGSGSVVRWTGRLIFGGVSLGTLHKRRQQGDPASLSARPAKEGPTSPSVVAADSRRRWFRVGAAVLVPAVGLVLLEFALRLAGYGYSASFLVRHPAAGPNVWVENQRFPWRFFPRTLARHPNPALLSPVKPAGVCRVLVLGESAAEGDPAPAFGFSRILQVLLQERHPGTRFEVVNLAFTAINSHVIVPIARDCQRLQGDVWLIYLGNNEVVGPFGTGTIFGRQSPPLHVIRANLAFKATRTGQLFDAVMQQVTPSREAAHGWGGMTMFLGEQVRRDDPRLAVLRDNFQKNLQDIIALGRGAGARVVVSTIVSRLRDWPPFGSLHRADLTEAQRLEWERLYQVGVAAETAGDMPGAIRSYEQAARIDSEFAELHFRWGRCFLTLGQPEDARAHFALARDFDTLRFRSDSRLNELIRQTVAAQPGGEVRLLDAEKSFERQSTNGIPGAEWLYEHVHFTFTGNYLLARLFAEEVAAALPPSARPDSAASRVWLSEDECASRLGYTDSQRYEIANLLRRRFEEPIYRQQLDHAERVTQVEQELASLRGAAKPAARHRALLVCRRALASAPDDWVLHDLTARLLGGLDDRAAAESEWRQVSRLIPHAALSYTEIGKLQQQQGNAHEAIVAFCRAIEVNPDHAEAYVGLGSVYSQQGRRTDAIRSFRKALRLDPTRQEAADGLAKLSAGSARHRRRRLRLATNFLQPRSRRLPQRGAPPDGRRLDTTTEPNSAPSAPGCRAQTSRMPASQPRLSCSSSSRQTPPTGWPSTSCWRIDC